MNPEHLKQQKTAAGLLKNFLSFLQGNPNRFVKKPCLEAGLWRDVPVPVSAPEADPQWQARHAPESGEGAGQAGQGRQESRPRPPAVLRYARMLRSFLGRTLAW